MTAKRFERRRQGRHQFWEVQRTGSEVTFRFGEVGTPGRSRTRHHRSERAAQNAVETGEREMTQRGYRRVLTAPVTASIEDSPVFERLIRGGDDEAWMIHADWLQERGDPLGHQVARAVDGHPVEVRIPELEALSAEVRVEARNGYLDAIEVIAGAGTEDTDTVVLQTLQRPRAKLLRRLRLVTPHAGSVVPWLELPALESLTVSIHRFRQATTREPLDLDALAQGCPRLTELAFCRSFQLRGTGLLPNLRHLRLGSWAFTDARQLDLPNLERLTLDHLDDSELERLLKTGLPSRARTLVFNSGGLDLLIRHGGPPHVVFPRFLYDHPELARIPGMERATLSGVVPASLVDELHRRGVAVDGTFTVSGHVEPASAERPSDLKMMRLEHTDGKTPRFWEIGRAGKVVHVRYGQLGHNGRWYHKAFPDEEIAEEARQERLKEKLGQGYEVLAVRTSHP